MINVQGKSVELSITQPCIDILLKFGMLMHLWWLQSWLKVSRAGHVAMLYIQNG